MNLLLCETPRSWVEAAALNEQLLLVDHANCEKKAASMALSFMFHPRLQRYEFQKRLSEIAREEIRHYEAVLRRIKDRGQSYVSIRAGRYARMLHQEIRAEDPARLVDSLLVAAMIEARSCERFVSLQSALSEATNDLYATLADAESRHRDQYLDLARGVAPDGEVENRLDRLRSLERTLIESPDAEFRFHSGPPKESATS